MMSSKFTKAVANFIFWSRWLQLPMYVGLIAALGIYVYKFFVSRLHIDDHPDQPEWLDHVDAGVLKIKLGMALVSISSIHLLRSFINTNNMSEHTLKWEVIIHVVLVLSVIFIALTDWLIQYKATQTHKIKNAGH